VENANLDANKERINQNQDVTENKNKTIIAREGVIGETSFP
jgi:hypothetical protein